VYVLIFFVILLLLFFLILLFILLSPRLLQELNSIAISFKNQARRSVRLTCAVPEIFSRFSDVSSC